MLAIVLSSGALMGLGGAVAAIASGAAGWGTHRLARKRLGPELRELGAEYEGKIAQAASDAVGVIERALKSSETQLESVSAQLDDVLGQLEQARKDLRRALAERDERDTIIDALRGQVRQLEGRVADLEAQLQRRSA